MKVDRSAYLPDGWPDDEFNAAIWNEHTTVPTRMMAQTMLDLLAPNPDDVILEVGTGSGYQTACLAEVVREVVSLEPNPIEGVAEKLPENVMCVFERVQDYEPDDEFDGCVCTCGITEGMVHLIGKYLREGATLIAPVGDVFRQELRKYEKRDGVMEDLGTFEYVRFSFAE